MNGYTLPGEYPDSGGYTVMDDVRTVLLVEDEPLIAMAEKSQLEKEGFHVAVVGTGEEAIEYVRENEDVELVLMDFDLGAGMNGVAAAEQIIRYRDVPVVFLSSRTEREIEHHAKRIAASGYVRKGAGFSELRTAITVALERRNR